MATWSNEARVIELGSPLMQLTNNPVKCLVMRAQPFCPQGHVIADGVNQFISCEQGIQKTPLCSNVP